MSIRTLKSCEFHEILPPEFCFARRAHLILVIRVVVIYETLRSLGVLRDGVVAPPLPHVPVAVVVPAAVVESMGQLVAEDRADGAVIQYPAIEIVSGEPIGANRKTSTSI